MDVERLVSCLDDPSEAAVWLASLGVQDAVRGHHNLTGIANSGLTLDLLAVICEQLERDLPQVSDPDLALNTLERFVSASRNPLAFGTLVEREPDALTVMLQLAASSKYLGDLLVGDPESYDLLRMTEGQPVAREVLVEEICSEVDNLSDPRDVMAALRRYKRRENLRIAYGDIISQQRIETVTRQISHLADAICEAAIRSARRELEKKWGSPRGPDGRLARFVALGMGKLGGVELNYASDIDLILVYDVEGSTDGRHATSNDEFFHRLAQKFVQLLTEPTELGFAYRVDLRLRPRGAQGPLCLSRNATLKYYDVTGRTWERQAFIKARPIAGDLELGQELLHSLEPWIYRRYLSRADITGIKALKRRIERRALHDGADDLDVKTGHGGIRDIEFIIQFLQLLNGGDVREVRTPNTLEAIAQLEQAGCLTMQERTILASNYEFLRKVEHRLQVMFDLQTHELPSNDEELRKVALRTGYRNENGSDALTEFRQDFQAKTGLNRQILDHLLHDAFEDDPKTDPEVDLVLDPDPDQQQIESILGPYGFEDVPDAYHNLMELSLERIPFLSTRRCRHFLAAIAPSLLRAIAETPDPDATLVNLSRVSDSLGGKRVLWELFSFNSPSLNLYVRLCAASPYLSSILTSYPGMLDELLDSLMLDKLPSFELLKANLDDLCRTAEDIDPMLHSFKNTEHLNVGVRDILGKEDIQATTAALSDVAEVCLQKVANTQYERLTRKYGEPRIGSGADARSCELTIIGMGKLGGREPNYHSDIDLMFLYEADGYTVHARNPKRGQTTSNQHFFGELGQRIVKAISDHGPYGRLYESDSRLRPAGKGAPLAVSFDEFRRYHEEGAGQLWERQALCQSRPVSGSPAARDRVKCVIRDVVTGKPWKPAYAAEIRDMRYRMEEGASRRNLKRGVGGTVDIEFATQMLQLAHVAENPDVFRPGTLVALRALEEAGYLPKEDAEFLSESYRFLRSVEARVRLMNTTARHDLPEDPHELSKLAYLLNTHGPESLATDCQEYMRENRLRFGRIFETRLR